MFFRSSLLIISDRLAITSILAYNFPGTWFVQSMVEVFMNHAYNLELIDLLRMTSEYLSRFTNEFQEKQTCNVEMRHLYKRIYFNPGLHRARGGGKLKRSQSTPPASPRRTRGADGGDGGGV